MKLNSIGMHAGMVAAALIPTAAAAETDAATQPQEQATDSGKKTEGSAQASEPTEIIVTARKKSERLVDTPISITAFPALFTYSARSRATEQGEVRRTPNPPSAAAIS